jgi:hypothetical protein
MRCPNGTRKNPKTHVCEKKKSLSKSKPSKQKSLSKQKATIKNKKPLSPLTQEPVCEFSLKNMWLKEIESFEKKEPVKSDLIDKIYSKLSLKVHPDALTECYFEEPSAFIIELTHQKDTMKTKMDALTAKRKNILNFRKFIEKLHC